MLNYSAHFVVGQAALFDISYSRNVRAKVKSRKHSTQQKFYTQ